MHARPMYARRQPSRSRSLGWLAAGALVALALLPGTSVQDAYGSAPTQGLGSEGYLTAEATPTPTPAATPTPETSPTPEASPTPTPEATPTPTPSPTPEASIPLGTLVDAWKLIDADGDPNTFADQELAAGWTVKLETDGAIFGWNPVTGVDERHHAFFSVAFDDPTEATITEEAQHGYELIDASCIDITEGPYVFPGNPRELAVGDLVGELEGDSVTFTMSHGEVDQVIACIFVNTPIPEGGVGGATATLPPTDTLPGPSAPSSESLRIVLVVIAGLLANVLILTPDRANRRASSGNEGDSRVAGFLDHQA